MSPLCQFETTLPADFPGGVWGDGSTDERWGVVAARGAEVERRDLLKALLPHVRRFYAGYFDPEAHLPYYRGSSRQ
jgi:hypothetical protein